MPRRVRIMSLSAGFVVTAAALLSPSRPTTSAGS